MLLEWVCFLVGGKISVVEKRGAALVKGETLNEAKKVYNLSREKFMI